MRNTIDISTFFCFISIIQKKLISIRLLVAALTVLLAGLVAEARVEVSETSMEHLQLYVLREKCWGEAAMAEYIAFQVILSI